MFKILDCTLRDGGYHNNWNFNPDLINKYLKSMSELKIDLIEIGFRSIKKKGNYGPLAQCSPIFLNSLKIPSNLKKKLGIMINAKEFLNLTNSKFSEKLNFIFPKSKKDPISFIRIACQENEIYLAIKIIDFLKYKKLKIFINLMQITEINKKKIVTILNRLSKKNVEAFYIADSLGALIYSDVPKLINFIKKNTNFKIGIHAHNNKLMALSNSLEAYKSGVKYIDSTINGMGRGCGNTATEYLFLEREKKNKNKINFNRLKNLMNLIENNFQDLKKKYNWNDNIYYYLAGDHKIHPTYIQKLISNKNYTVKKVFIAIKNLLRINSKNFDIKNIKNYNK